MTQEKMGVHLTSQEEIREQLLARTHWFVAFGRSVTFAIDMLDEALGVYPTFPTLFFPVLMTIIPKARISRRQLQAALQKGINKNAVVGYDQDIVILGEPEETPGIAEFFASLAEGAHPA